MGFESIGATIQSTGSAGAQAKNKAMTAPLAALAIFSTHVLAIPLCGLIAYYLGNVELMPAVFAVLLVAAMYLPERGVVK